MPIRHGSAVLAVLPAALFAICGVLVLVESLRREALGARLLDAGYFAVADTVIVDRPTGGGPVTAVRLSFPAADGRQIYTALGDHEVVPPTPGGLQAPAAGTRYAAPLQIVYDREAPERVLAVADAQQWRADRQTRWVAAGLIAGGLVTAVAVRRSSRPPGRAARAGRGRRSPRGSADRPGPPAAVRVAVRPGGRRG